MKVLSVFPLIGGGYLGVEYLQNIRPDIDIENLDIGFSLSGAKANEESLIENRPIDIVYWDEKYADVECHCMTCDAESNDYDEECKRIEACIADNKDYISQADIILSIPPCSSLCMLNASKASRTGKGNRSSQIIIRCVEFALKSGVPYFCFENAPALAARAGLSLLEQIEDKMKKYPGYSMNIIKTSTVFHGVPQKRSRAFVMLTKGDLPRKLDFEVKITDLMDVIGDISEDGLSYATEPQTELQKYFRAKSTELSGVDVTANEKYLKTWNKVFEFLGVPRHTCLFKVVEDVNEEEFLARWDAYDWGDINVDQERKFFSRIIKKVAQGKGFWSYEPLTTKLAGGFDVRGTTAIVGKNMGRYVHPNGKRVLNFREECRMMGIPDDFIIPAKRKHHITQNVPATTFARMIEQLVDYQKKEQAEKPVVFSYVNKAGTKNVEANTVTELF